MGNYKLRRKQNIYLIIKFSFLGFTYSTFTCRIYEKHIKIQQEVT